MTFCYLIMHLQVIRHEIYYFSLNEPKSDRRFISELFSAQSNKQSVVSLFGLIEEKLYQSH